jgi:hypothetical protein
MAHKIQIKRGNKADLPTLDVGEFGLCQDTNELFIGNSGNQKIFPPTAPTISDVEGLQTALDGKVDDSQVLTNVPANAKFTDTVTTINGKTGAITKSDITALGIPAQDTVYTHPATHSADMIVDGTTNKAYTATEKNKLAGIETGANKTTIVNNLTETIPGKTLDATQGKVLNDNLVSHKEKTATENDLGHVKVDGETIVVDNGVISAVGLDYGNYEIVYNEQEDSLDFLYLGGSDD